MEEVVFFFKFNLTGQTVKKDGSRDCLCTIWMIPWF
jgi:hypothetical protein